MGGGVQDKLYKRVQKIMSGLLPGTGLILFGLVCLACLHTWI